MRKGTIVDRWTDRLSEYLDGELAAPERARLEAHLAVCADCRGVLEELRQVVATAAALPDEPPARDLWVGIEARLGPTASAGEANVISLAQRRRRFSFTLPQLAAAGVALMAVSTGLVWLLVERGPQATAPSQSLASGSRPAVSAPAASPALDAEPVAPAGESVPRLAAAAQSPAQVNSEGARSRVRLVRARPLSPQAQADRDYNRAVADLQAVLRQERSRLQPQTVKALQASLADIDRAIADARRALARDPGSVYLNAHLAESRRLKLELLQQVVTITQS